MMVRKFPVHQQSPGSVDGRNRALDLGLWGDGDDRPTEAAMKLVASSIRSELLIFYAQIQGGILHYDVGGDGDARWTDQALHDRAVLMHCGVETRRNTRPRQVKGPFR